METQCSSHFHLWSSTVITTYRELSSQKTKIQEDILFKSKRTLGLKKDSWPGPGLQVEAIDLNWTVRIHCSSFDCSSRCLTLATTLFLIKMTRHPRLDYRSSDRWSSNRHCPDGWPALSPYNLQFSEIRELSGFCRRHPSCRFRRPIRWVAGYYRERNLNRWSLLLPDRTRQEKL